MTSAATDVLLVSARPSWGERVAAAMTARGLSVERAEDADDAFALVYAVAVRLVVFDLEGAADSREELEALFDPRTSPVGFLFAADCPGVEALVSRVATQLGASPPPRRGEVGEAGLVPVLEELRETRAHGILIARQARFVARVVLVDGHIAVYASSAVEDRVGQICVARGVATEEELRRSLAVQRDSRQPLGAVLAEITSAPDDIERALLAHRREAIAELCLWDRGEWELHPSAAPLASTDGTLPLEDVIARGRAMREEWLRIRDEQWLDDTTVVRAGVARQPLDARARALVAALGDGESIEAARLSLRWHRLETYRALAALIRSGAAIVTSRQSARAPRQPSLPPLVATAPAPSRATARPDAGQEHTAGVDELLARASDLMAADRHTARELVLDALAMRPTHGEALRLLARFDREDRSSAQVAGISPKAVLRLDRPLGSLTSELTPEAAFVLSRLDVATSVTDLLCVCPLPEHQVLNILSDAVKRGWLAVV